MQKIKRITVFVLWLVAGNLLAAFLTFELAAQPNDGPVIVRVIGPAGAKEFVKTVIWKPTVST